MAVMVAGYTCAVNWSMSRARQLGLAPRRIACFVVTREYSSWSMATAAGALWVADGAERMDADRGT